MNNPDDKFGKALQVVKRVDDSPDLVDVMLSIEDYLDRNDIYAFKNWILGELIDGPNIMPYWIKVGFKWPGDKMPDPSGAERLLPHGTKIGFMKTSERQSQPINSQSDYAPGTHKPKIADVDIWIVEMLIPRRFVENIDSEIMDLYDDRIDDMDTSANAEGENTTEDNALNATDDTGDLGNETDDNFK